MIRLDDLVGRALGCISVVRGLKSHVIPTLHLESKNLSIYI